MSVAAGDADAADAGGHVDGDVVDTGRLPGFDRSLTVATQEAHDIVEQAKAEHRPEATFLLLSGGNDSMVLLDSMAEHADAIVHVNTGIGIPEANEHARSVAAPYSLPFHEMHPPVAYEELVLTLPVLGGMPGPGVHHIIFQRLKERCIEALLRSARSRNGERFLLLSGVRRAESKRRMGYDSPVDRKGGQVWVNPLFHWLNPEMAAYRKAHNTPQSEVAANLHMSGECLCGAMADQGPERHERKQIAFFYPEFDRRLCDLEEACRSKGLPYDEWGVKRPNWKDDRSGPMCAGCENRLFTDDDEECPVEIAS